MEQTISIVAVGAVSGIVFAYIGYLRGLKKDSYTAGTARGALEADIVYIKHRTDDVFQEQKDTNKNINILADRVTRVEESAKSAHKRINQMSGKDAQNESNN